MSVNPGHNAHSRAVRPLLAQLNLNGFSPKWLAVFLLSGALLIRLPFAATDFHATVDLELFKGWARAAQRDGLQRIYEQPGVNYPPLSIYWLAFAGMLERRAPAAWNTDDRFLNGLVKLPSILADVATAALIGWAIWPRGERRAVCAIAAYALNPAIWYVSVHWGQSDSLYACLLIAAVIALDRGAIIPGWGCYALALAAKVQSIALAPLFLTWTLTHHGWRSLAVGLTTSLAIGALVFIPWLTGGRSGITKLMDRTLASTEQRVDLSAYNASYLALGGNVHTASSQIHPFGLPASWRSLQLGMFAAWLVLITALAVTRQAPLALSAALCTFGLYMFAPAVHERFLFPTLGLLLLAAGQVSGVTARALAIAFGILSLTFLFNLITIAPFSDVLGTNLVAAVVDSPWVSLLKQMALVAAALNLAVLVGLTLILAREPRGTAYG